MIIKGIDYKKLTFFISYLFYYHIFRRSKAYKDVTRVIIMHEVQVLEELHEMMENVRKGIHRGGLGQRELKLYDKGIGKLKINHRAGCFVKEAEHPKPYVHYTKKIGKRIIALWKLDVHPRWRLIYTTTAASENPDDAKFKPLFCFVIDFLDHNEYNRIFGYRGC